MFRRSIKYLCFFLVLVTDQVCFAHAARTTLTTTTFFWLSPSQDAIDGVYSIGFGDIPAQKLRKSIDLNSDGHISESEKTLFTQRIRDKIRDCVEVEIDGQRVLPELELRFLDFEDHRVVPLWIRVDYQTTFSFQKSSTNSIKVRDRCDFDARSQSEVKIEPSDAVSQLSPPNHSQDQGSLSFDFSGDLPPPLQFTLSFDGPLVGHTGQPSQLEREENILADFLRGDQNMSIWIILLAFVLGAFHALSPGHGKTLVAAYLVGEKGTIFQAILLGLVVTLTHVASVVLVGLLALWASQSLLPSSVSKTLSVASGAIITLIGLSMIRKRIRHYLGQAHDHSHHHHVDGGLWRIISLGISGGIVPCPSAMVVLLLAISVGRIAEGMILISAFSFGLAIVLVLIGILVVQGKKTLDRFLKGRTTLSFLPVVSSVLVTLLGIIVCVEGMLR